MIKQVEAAVHRGFLLVDRALQVQYPRVQGTPIYSKPHKVGNRIKAK